MRLLVIDSILLSGVVTDFAKLRVMVTVPAERRAERSFNRLRSEGGSSCEGTGNSGILGPVFLRCF